tara:strand:- start:1955 stop:2587 length:633 start_codon:yes stop_codon:yes gene_type:complete
MVNTIGECKNVRAIANNHSTLTEIKHCDARTIGQSRSAKPQAELRGPTSLNGDATTLPPAVTKAERAEERLGMAMLSEALDNPLIPNPEKWRRATALAQARRAQLTKERRERVKVYAEEGIFTVPQVAQMERVVQTTIRSDSQVMGVRLRASVIKVTQYQEDIAARREQLEVLAKTGITRQAASEELGVSEATVRRDIMIMRISWTGDSR